MLDSVRRFFQAGEKPEQPQEQIGGIPQDSVSADFDDFDPRNYVRTMKTYEPSNPAQNPSEISIPNYPEFSTIQKVDNTAFAEERAKRINAVFEAVRPYYDFMIGYEALAANPALANELKRAIKTFILTFWDMPASRNDHHSGRFGLLTHSLQSACECAASVAHNNVFDEYGMDSERSYKERGWRLFGYFLLGLLHDANKIFDYRVKARRGSGWPEIEFQPLSGSLLNFKMTFPTEFTTCTWENFENIDFVFIPHFFFFIIPWKTQMAMPHSIYIEVLSQLTQNNEDEGKKISDVRSIMLEINDPKTRNALLSAIRKTLLSCFDDLADIHTTPLFRLDNNWYAADYHAVSSSLAKHMRKSKEYITRLMYNAKLMGGLTIGTSKPLCSVKVTVFPEKGKQNSGYNKELCFIKSEIIEPAILDIYRDKQPDADIEASSLAGIRREAVLIHPHYYALAQLFCEMMPIQDHVFGTPEGKIVAPPTVEEGIDDTYQRTLETSDEDPFNADPFMDAPPACGVRDEVIAQGDDGAGIFDDKPQTAEIPPDSRKRGGSVTLITIGGGSDDTEPKEPRAASEIDDKNDDAPMAETGKLVADSLPSLDQELANVVGSFQNEMKPSNPAAADSEDITHAVTQAQFSNFQTENTENTEAAHVSIHSRLHPPTGSVPADRNRVDCPLPEERDCWEGMPGYAGRQTGISLKGEVSDHKGIFDEAVSAEEATAQEMEDRETPVMPEQGEAPAMQEQPERVVEREVIGADVSDSSGEVTQEGEEYLDADGMPTLKLARAMMPLFVKNYLLQILPSQQKAGNCALFVVKSGKMYMGRDINFAYLWEYAKKDGLLPKDAKILPGGYDRLAKYWLQLNYLEKSNSSNLSTTYTRLNLFDSKKGEKGEWITESLTLYIPYLVNFRNISKEVSLKSIPEVVHFADKTFEQLVDDIVKVRYKRSLGS
jgi:hypothetical protein